VVDLLSVSDRDTWAYGEDLRSMATKKGFCRLTFSRIKDLVDFPSPDKLNEITYVASATNFRRCLLNQYGDDNIDIEREISTNNDTMATYLGYRRFLVSDLKYIFPLGEARSKTAYKRDVKYLAQQMLIRGYVSIDRIFELPSLPLLTLEAGLRRSSQICISQSSTSLNSPVDRRAQDLTQSSEHKDRVHDSMAL
jgi:pyoverdine/dityrosine biosynthesis protein Dit1